MTAKEFITEHYGQPTDDMEAEQQKEFAELMNEFARHIAEKAVDECGDLNGAESVKLLSRIKELTQGESPLTQTNEDK